MSICDGVLEKSFEGEKFSMRCPCLIYIKVSAPRIDPIVSDCH